MNNKFLKSLRGAIDRNTKIKSWPATIVGTGSKPAYSKVKFTNGLEMDVLNYRFASIGNLKVRVGYDPLYPDILQVLGVREGAMFSSATNNPNFWVPDHHTNHEYPNHDTVWVQGAQFLPLNVMPTSGLTVRVYGSVLRGIGEWVGFQWNDIDLTSYEPASGACYCLIEIDETGVVVVTEGAAKASRNQLVYSDIPEPTAGRTPIAAVVRFVGQTDIIRDVRVGKRNDVVDLRWSASASNGGITDAPADGTVYGRKNSAWENLDDLYVPYAQQVETKDPTGWLSPESITVSYDTSTRKITLTGTLVYYWQGVKHTLTSPWTSDAHDSADGNYFLYSTNGSTFTWSTADWSFDQLMVAKASKSTSPAYQYAIREVHGLMPWQVHRELHEQISSYRDSGGSLTADTYAENSASDANTTPGFDAALIRDEDCPTTIPAWTQGTYTTLRIGASNKATFDVAATFPFRSSGSYILINDPTTGGESATVTGRYVNVYQVLIPAASDVNSQKYRMVMLQPQRSYTSLAAAQAEDTRQLLLGDLATTSPEFVFYARITYLTGASDANTGKCRIATGGVTYIAGSRQAQVSVAGFAPPNAENVPLTPAGNLESTNVQLGMQELDSEKPQRWTAKTTAPTVNDDSADGYAVGDRWLDEANDKEYVALDVTVSAAVWKETTLPSGGDVNGPGSSTDNAVVRFDSTTGKLLQSSTVKIDDIGRIDQYVPSGGTGEANVALGRAALNSIHLADDAGSLNTSVGSSSLVNAKNANLNVGLGSNAGSAIVDGDYNVFLGAFADAPNTVGQSNAQNRIAIGYGTKNAEDNTAVVGNDDTTKTTLRGNVNIDSGKTYNINGSPHTHTGLVTNGDSHDHNGGDGAQINHANLSSIGTNTHAQIDSHISNTSNPHGVTAAQAGALATTGGTLSGNLTVTNSNVRSVSATINDDSVLSWTPGTDRGAIKISVNSANHYGTAYYRATASPLTIPNEVGSSFAVTTGVLTGTSGTDGKTTLSAASDGKLYLENRSGAALAYVALQM